jgi:hypothetical protein
LNKLEREFLPLDNTENKRPDWFELWVIKEFLKSADLDENRFYGFLSPKFKQKTGYSGKCVMNILERIDPDYDVVLFSSYLHHLAIFYSPFEQGEIAHPGLINASENFLANFGLKVDLKKFVTWTGNSVFSNYVVAKPVFLEKLA